MGAGRALADEPPQVVPELGGAVIGTAEGFITHGQLDGKADRLSPVITAPVVLVRDAHQLADHRDRDQVCIPCNQVASPVALERVDQLVHDMVHIRSQPFDRSRRERPRNQSPEAGVLRWVHEGDHVGQGLHHGAAFETRVLAQAGGVLTLAERRRPQDRRTSLVGGNEGHSGCRMVLHDPEIAQLVV